MNSRLPLAIGIENYKRMIDKPYYLGKREFLSTDTGYTQSLKHMTCLGPHEA